MTDPVAFINVEKTISSNYAARYASDVYQCLEQKGFHCLYAIDGVSQYNVPFITYANVIVEKSSSFLEMNYHATLILAVVHRSQSLKAAVPMNGLLGLRTERLYA